MGIFSGDDHECGFCDPKPLSPKLLYLLLNFPVKSGKACAEKREKAIDQFLKKERQNAYTNSSS